MYTAYMIFAIVMIVSFITGSIILLVEHRQKKDKDEIEILEEKDNEKSN